MDVMRSTSSRVTLLAPVMVIPPVVEPRSWASALGQMTWDNIAHGGQIAYLRGLFIGMGWHR
ncbi:MAG: hypothetical protein IH919_10780 [Deltaproteobacteria bacterium]|nr:hypothetical protein [Deltaproteobacteria bacterium]